MNRSPTFQYSRNTTFPTTDSNYGRLHVDKNYWEKATLREILDKDAKEPNCYQLAKLRNKAEVLNLKSFEFTLSKPLVQCEVS